MAKAGAKLTSKQTEYTRFVYDLTRDYPGQVPDRALVYKPSKSDLARIDARYYAVRPATPRATGTTSPSARRSTSPSASGTRAPASSG